MTPQDLKLLAAKGITEQQIAEQLACFNNGFPYLKLSAAASIESGILQAEPEKQKLILDAWESYIFCTNRTIVKFVPASGAASRMFKNLFEFLDADHEQPQTPFEKNFFDQLNHFAFYNDLDACCRKLYGQDIEQLRTVAPKKIVSALLSAEGLNYGALPKGLLKFHHYEHTNRTPAEEHLVEGALYATGKDGKVNVHFTVSPEHHALFELLIKEKVPAYAKQYGVEFQVSFSEQKPSTDTIAVDMNNQPFREEDGTLLFRPGGHGALIENLNDLDADIVFIKNIDNVVPDKLKGDTVLYKKLLAGVLVTLQQQAFHYLRMLDSGKYTHEQIIEMLHFLQRKLFCRHPKVKDMEDSELVIYLKSKLNRPMRVCGMVRNEGEPGGGPFLAYNTDGTISLQILESSQIDMNDNEKRSMFEQGTHFNPVDLVCAIKDYQGKRFDLTKYVDKNTGFISHKSKNGKELKALELPGLWNGAMSDWNTIFMEVPLSTFNPVKTVNDLLREEHQ
jgi:hypothetical protein